MPKGILEAALTAEQKQKGFSFDEPDDHTLELLYKGKPVAHFIQSVATVQLIRAVADCIAQAEQAKLN